MPTPRRTLLVLLVALVAATGLASAWANETPRSSFVVATRAEPATDAGLDDAAPDGVADGSASDSGAADALPPVVADAAPAFDTASEPPLRRGISLSPANADEPTGSPLTRRQWLYVLIGAAIGVLLLMAVPTRT